MRQDVNQRCKSREVTAIQTENVTLMLGQTVMKKTDLELYKRLEYANLNELLGQTSESVSLLSIMEGQLGEICIAYPSRAAICVIYFPYLNEINKRFMAAPNPQPQHRSAMWAHAIRLSEESRGLSHLSGSLDLTVL